MLSMQPSAVKRRGSRLCNAWMNIDVKSFMAGMLVVGLLVVFQQNFRSKQLIHAVTYLDFREQNQQYNNSLIVRSIPNSMFDRTDYVNSSDYPPLTAKDPASRPFNQSKDYIDKHDLYPSQYNGRNVLNAHDQDTVKNGSYHGHNEDFQHDMVSRRRFFHAYGQALALFVHMGSYRGGPDSFAVIGLGAKPAHVYGNAGFECEWVPANDLLGNRSIKGKTVKYLPDWNMGRQYTVVVMNCSFEQPVGVDREGGKLMVYALYGEGSGRLDMTPERFVALTEKKDEYDAEKFRAPHPYKFVYCGSPLYGNLNAQRMREWMAYHTKLFGKQAHFFLYDAGGVTASVERVLQPWSKRGYVTLQDIREETRFDGYYHNQFLVVNDCLHRTRFLATWTFFFDVDEYVYVPKEHSLQSVMQGFSNYTQVIFRQKPMAAHLCAPSTHLNISSTGTWGFEKLVYRNVKAGITWDRKYAIQARRAFTAGVHRSDHIAGDDIVRESLGYFPESLVPGLWYYHFHNTITHNGKLCTSFVEPLTNHNITSNTSTEPPHFIDTDGTPYRLDIGLQELALSIKTFEVQCIGAFDSP